MTIDEILATMPEPAAEGDRDYLVIDPATRTIAVPDSERIFGVTGDELAARKFFLCPRYVGNGLDLASMFLTVYFRNANSEADGCAVTDVAVEGDYITFSWELSEKVTKYMGPVQFSVCADLPNTDKLRRPDWNTTTATGECLEGLHPDLADVTEESSDLATQLRAQIAASTAAVAACGAEQVEVVKNAAEAETAAAVAAVQTQGAATRESIPADYSKMAATVDRLSRDRAAAIVCEAAGAAIQVHDASNDPLLGLRIFGRSTQDGTPTPENPVEIVSLEKPVVTISDGTEENVQTLAITTPGSLPGIPVASGGNYTDENGQQWICDEVDLARGVYVQRIITTILDGTQAYETSGRQLDGTYTGYANLIKVWVPEGGLFVSNRFICYSEYDYPTSQKEGVYTNSSLVARGAVIIRLNSDRGVTDANSLKEWLSSNPVTVLCPLKNPVETALTDAEVQAFRALHSYKPTTTVLNDAGAHMMLEYAADPKTYIDNKLAALGG